MDKIDITFRDALLEHYPKRGKILQFFEKANKCSWEWENFSKINLNRFKDYLLKKVSPNSAKQYIQIFKAVVNRYIDNFDMPTNWETMLQTKNDASQQIYLTENDILRIINVNPRNDAMRYVQNSFVVGCLTGSRHSDYVTFTTDDIRDGYLVYVSKKTHIESKVPLSKTVVRILKENERNDIQERVISDDYFNDLVRELCKMAGINESMKLYRRGKYEKGEKWQFSSSHTARRSFATNLYLRGADLYQISKMMGHTSVKQTERYICCGLKDISPEVKGFFNSFK